MIRKCTFTIKKIEEVLKPIVLSNLETAKVNKNREKSIKVAFAEEEIFALSDRYKTFFTSGYKCPVCGIEGKFFALEKYENNDSYHLNLYGIDNDGNEMLMTKDHIIPKSLGGKNHYTNYRTMCQKCNSERGNGLVKKAPDPNSDTSKKKQQLVFPDISQHAIVFITLNGKALHYISQQNRIEFLDSFLAATNFNNFTAKKKFSSFIEKGLLDSNLQYEFQTGIKYGSMKINAN